MTSSSSGRAHVRLTLFLLLLSGCSNSAATTGPDASATDASTLEASAPHACTPLATGDAKPTALKNVLGAGRHPDSTVYVLDDGVAEYRAFVSTGMTLHRKVVSGSGTSENQIVATVDDPPAPFTLKIETASGVAKRMGVLRGKLEGKDFSIGSGGSDELTLLGASDLAAYAVLDVPSKVFVEYDAFTPDGRRIVVVRPEVDWRYEDFRLFLGKPPKTMLERKVIDVARGSTTTIRFELDGAVYVAFFPSTLSPNAGPPTLAAEGGTKATLTLADGSQASTRESLSYTCIR